MNLDDYIKQHKEDFDLDEPAEGHFERFELRLANNTKKTRRLTSYKYTAIVACSLLLLTLGSLFFRGQQETQSCSLSPELAEMRTYYESRINQLVNKIEVLSKEVDQELANTMLTDAAKIQNEVKSIDYCQLAVNGKAVKSTVKRYNLELDALLNMLVVLEQNQTTPYEKQ